MWVDAAAALSENRNFNWKMKVSGKSFLRSLGHRAAGLPQIPSVQHGEALKCMSFRASGHFREAAGRSNEIHAGGQRLAGSGPRMSFISSLTLPPQTLSVLLERVKAAQKARKEFVCPPSPEEKYKHFLEPIWTSVLLCSLTFA